LVAVGTLAPRVAHPRGVFAPLLRRRADDAILLHTDHRDIRRAAQEDADIITRLAEAGRLLGVPVHDDIMVARNGYVGFRDAGALAWRLPLSSATCDTCPVDLTPMQCSMVGHSTARPLYPPGRSPW